MLRLALNAITSFSYFPLQLATYMGFFAAGLSILTIPVIVVMRLIGQQAFLDRPPGRGTAFGWGSTHQSGHFG